MPSSRQIKFNKLSLPTITKTILVVTINDQREEVVLLELAQIYDELVVEKSLNIIDVFNIDLSFVVRLQFNLPILSNFCIYFTDLGLTEVLIPKPTDLKHGWSGVQAPGVVFVLEETGWLAFLETRIIGFTSDSSGSWIAGLNSLRHESNNSCCEARFKYHFLVFVCYYMYL